MYNKSIHDLLISNFKAKWCKALWGLRSPRCSPVGLARPSGNSHAHMERVHKISLAVLLLTARRVSRAPQDSTPFMGSITHGFIIMRLCGHPDPPTRITRLHGRAYMILKSKSRLGALRGALTWPFIIIYRTNIPTEHTLSSWKVENIIVHVSRWTIRGMHWVVVWDDSLLPVAWVYLVILAHVSSLFNLVEFRIVGVVWLNFFILFTFHIVLVKLIVQEISILTPCWQEI